MTEPAFSLTSYIITVYKYYADYKSACLLSCHSLNGLRSALFKGYYVGGNDGLCIVYNSALLVLTVFLGTSAFSVYGLSSSKTGGTVDAIASATQAAPKPVVKPVVIPAPQPAPIFAAFTETAMGLTDVLALGGCPFHLKESHYPVPQNCPVNENYSITSEGNCWLLEKYTWRN